MRRKQTPLPFSTKVVGGVQIAPLPPGKHQECGSWEYNSETNLKEWTPREEFVVPYSFRIQAGKTFRRKNRALARSRMVAHFYTRKYAALLARYRPDLYVKLHGYDENGIIAQLLKVNHIKLKLIGEVPAWPTTSEQS